MNTVTNYITVGKDTHEVLFSIDYYDIGYNYLVVFSDLAFAGIPKVQLFDKFGNEYIGKCLTEQDKANSVLFKCTLEPEADDLIKVRVTEQSGGQKTVAFTYKPHCNMELK